MPDDQLTAAVQALLKQVSTLTTALDDMTKKQVAQDELLTGVMKKNEQLLDKVQDTKRTAEKTATETTSNFLKTLEEQQRKRDLDNALPDSLRQNRPPAPGDARPLVISRGDARDPAAYREAKETASKQGRPLVVGNPDDFPDASWRNDQRTVEQFKVTTFDDPISGTRFIRKDLNGGAGLVRRRLDAERAGLRVQTFESADDLPEHCRSKFALLEAHEGGKT